MERTLWHRRRRIDGTLARRVERCLRVSSAYAVRQAAGVIVIAHNSGGPRDDIVGSMLRCSLLVVLSVDHTRQFIVALSSVQWRSNRFLGRHCGILCVSDSDCVLYEFQCVRLLRRNAWSRVFLTRTISVVDREFNRLQEPALLDSLMKVLLFVNLSLMFRLEIVRFSQHFRKLFRQRLRVLFDGSQKLKTMGSFLAKLSGDSETDGTSTPLPLKRIASVMTGHSSFVNNIVKFHGVRC